MLPESSCSDPSRHQHSNEAKYNLKDPQQLAAFLKYADILLVRLKYLYELRGKNKLLPRRQEAEKWGLVSHEEVSEWAAGARDAMLISISHAWETREHPDPCGDQLNRLVDCLCLYDAAFESEIWVFYDYVSLFQFERQTSAEEESFRRSMSHMHVLYAHACNWTFRLEALTPDDVWDATLQNSEHLVMVYDVESGSVQGRPLGELVPNRVPYRSRGWCKAEVEWSSCRSISEQNQRIDTAEPGDSERQGLRGKVPMAPEVFEEEMRKAEFTHRNDAAAVLQLQWEIYHEEVSECEKALLANLPKGELGQLANALKDYKKLKVLSLQNFEVEDEEAEQFAKALAVNETITYLGINSARHSYRTGALWKVLADALTINHTIASINLGWNHLGDEGCKALADTLRTNATITSCNLEWNGIGDKGCEALADAVKTNTTITSINLRFNFLSRFGDKGCEAFADALKTNTAITSIDLRRNQIGPFGGKALADALKINRTIASINLEENYGIGHESLQEIEETLKTRKAATDSEDTATGSADAPMSHAWTGKQCKGMEGLASWLVDVNSNLTTLQCSSLSSWEVLAEALKINRKITTIDLKGIDMGDQGAKAIAGALTVNCTVTSILLHWNQIGDEGAKAIAEMLMVNRTVARVALCSNNIGNEGGKAIAKALSKNDTVICMDLEGNPVHPHTFPLSVRKRVKCDGRYCAACLLM
ncbi:Nlrc3 [Symbiodinium sp. CCMP2592]|nr:Nlrc3 [Symbiodinium sp. CCMP2592]